MNFEDLPTKRPSPVADIENEDLSTVSAEHLQERIDRLHAEIERTQAEINAKQASRAAADAFFKS